MIKARIKHIPLAFMGDGWEESFLEFRSFRFSDISRFAGSDKTSDDVMVVLKDTFIKGSAPDEAGDLTEMKSDDLDDLDAEAINQVVKALTGQADPN